MILSAIILLTCHKIELKWLTTDTFIILFTAIMLEDNQVLRKKYDKVAFPKIKFIDIETEDGESKLFVSI